MPLRITTWNVNGIRNPFGYQPWRDARTFEAMFGILEADIVIMQELKIQRKDLRDDMVLVPGWDCYFSLPKHKKGYSGVGIYTRQSVCAPIRAEEGLLGVLSPPGTSVAYRDLPDDQSIGGYPSVLQLTDIGVDPVVLDAEGRCVVLEFPAFVLFGLYSPANSNGLRDDFRYGFLTALDFRIRNLVKMGKRVVVTGDLNVSRGFLDTASAEENTRKEGITEDEYMCAPGRRMFNQLLEGGKVIGKRDEGREEPVMWDICRGFHEGRKGMYTHWETKINARPGNFGSRIDFVLCSLDMKSWFIESNIQEGLMGSDHCPVYAVMKDEVTTNNESTALLDLMNPFGMFHDGKRTRDYSTKDIPTFSGKLLPEFDKRRTIKDMFAKKSSQPTSKDSVESSFTASAVDSQSSAASEVMGSSQVSKPVPTIISNGKANHGSGNESTPTGFSAIGQKRRISNGTLPSVGKRSKSANSTTNNSSPKKGQQSLKGFFKPKASVGPLSEKVSNDTSDVKSKAEKDAEFEAKARPATDDNTSKGSSSPLLRRTSTFKIDSPTRDSELEPVIDQVASKETWDRLFTKRNAPLCESHGEPCITYTTKKSGINCGRSFWLCPRPVGPSGQKEKGTQWRCPTFIWASDWNST